LDRHRKLIPVDQDEALNLAKDIFRHFDDIDAAAQEKDYKQTFNEYQQLVSDFDDYLQLIPDGTGDA